MGIDRQVRYNLFTNTGDQESLRYKWTFFIINEPREIKRIEQRILETLAVCDEKEVLAESNISNSRGIWYKAFNLKSEKGFLCPKDKEKIYANLKKFKKDRNLREWFKKPDIWFDKYVGRLGH